MSGLAESVLVTAPAALQQMKYSREFEAEADYYARAQLRSRGIPAACLGSALFRIVNSLPERTSKEGEVQSGSEHPEDDESKRSDRVLDYLSTHPNIEERMAASGGRDCR